MSDDPRLSPSFQDVYSFSSLLTAFRKARRAKRGKGQEPAFYWNLEANLLRLSEELRLRTYQPDPYRYFSLYTKKERFIHKLRDSMAQAAHSVLSDEEEVARAASLCGHVSHANTLHLRRSVLAKHLR